MHHGGAPEAQDTLQKVSGKCELHLSFHIAIRATKLYDILRKEEFSRLRGDRRFPELLAGDSIEVQVCLDDFFAMYIC